MNVQQKHQEVLEPLDIRRYTEADIEDMIIVMRDFHASTAYGNLEFSNDRARFILRQNVRNDTMLVLVAAQGHNNIVGGVWAFVNKFMFSEQTFAECFGIYVRPDYRSADLTMKLFNEMVDWAKRRGARQISCASSTETETERFEAVMRFFKMRKIGSIWRKDI